MRVDGSNHFPRSCPTIRESKQMALHVGWVVGPDRFVRRLAPTKPFDDYFWKVGLFPAPFGPVSEVQRRGDGNEKMFRRRGESRLHGQCEKGLKYTTKTDKGRTRRLSERLGRNRCTVGANPIFLAWPGLPATLNSLPSGSNVARQVYIALTGNNVEGEGHHPLGV